MNFMRKAETPKSSKIVPQRISPTGQEILNFLKARGGSAPVGNIGANRTTTLKHLRRLESQGLIICVQAPQMHRTPPDYVGQIAFDSNCGIWKLADVETDKTGENFLN